MFLSPVYLFLENSIAERKAEGLFLSVDKQGEVGHWGKETSRNNNKSNK